MERQEIARDLEKQIKLYRHLGLKATEINAEKTRFEARLEDHLNHKGTAFGGSLYAIGVLAAYSLVLAALREGGVTTDDIVIAKGEIDYLRPVSGDFEAVCEFPSPLSREKFLSELKNNGKARQNLEVQIACAGKICARLRGVFAVKK